MKQKQVNDPELEAIAKLLDEWQAERNDNRAVVLMAYDNINETKINDDGLTVNNARFALSICGIKKNVVRAISAALRDVNFKPFMTMVMLQELMAKPKSDSIVKNN